MSATSDDRVVTGVQDTELTHRRKPGPGRRRDPEIDDKIRHAARAIYASSGWAGFHFDGVAKAAGVSKDSVYRRYADGQALLLGSLADRAMPSLTVGRQIEDSLVAYAVAIFDYLSSGDGYAYLRVHVDGPRYPDILREYQRKIVLPALARDVAALNGAREAGLVAKETDCEAVISALGGAVLLFALTQPRDDDCERPTVLRRMRRLVRQLLRGTGA